MQIKEWARCSPSMRGFTLIELMIAMTLGMFVVSALVYLYVSTRGASRMNENVVRVQESGRAALDAIERDMRLTGFMGCMSGANGHPLVISNPVLPYSGAADTAIGYAGGVGWTNPTTVARVAGDVITIRGALGGGTPITTTSDYTNAKFTLADNCQGFRQNDYFFIGDCQRAVVGKVTNVPAQLCGTGADATDILHAATGNGNNGIVTGATSNRFNAFAIDSRPLVYRMDEITYFVGNNAAGRRALYRFSRTRGTEELVENVADLSILYGEDTSGDGVADVFHAANAVVNWSSVLSVRIAVLVSSPDTNVVLGGSTYLFRDINGDGVVNAADAVTAPDTRLYRVFSSTVALRNRLP